MAAKKKAQAKPSKAVKTRTKRGRPTRYTQAIADEIVRRRAQGESLNAICESEKMPAESTVRSWVLDDLNGFSANYGRAVRIDSDREFDNLAALSDAATPETVQVDKLRIDTRKWVLSKRLPKVYGDKLDVEHSVSDDLMNRLLDARKRAGQ